GSGVPELDLELALAPAAASPDGEEGLPAEPLELARRLGAFPLIARAAARAAAVVEGRVQEGLPEPGAVLRDFDAADAFPPIPEVKGREIMGGPVGARKGWLAKGAGPPRLVAGAIPPERLQAAIEGVAPMLPRSEEWGSCAPHSGEVLLWGSEDMMREFRVYSLSNDWMSPMFLPGPLRGAIVDLPGGGVARLAAAVAPAGWFAPGESDARAEGSLAPARSHLGTARDDGGPEVRIGRGSPRLVLAASSRRNPAPVRAAGSRRWAVVELERSTSSTHPACWVTWRTSLDVVSCATAGNAGARREDAAVGEWCERRPASPAWKVRPWCVASLDMLEATDWWRAGRLHADGVGDVIYGAQGRCEGFRVLRSEDKSVKRARQTQRPQVIQRWMRTLVDRWVRCPWPGRESMMCFSSQAHFLARFRGVAPPPLTVRQELMSALAAMPMLKRDLRALCSRLVAMSDAGAQRGIALRAARLRPVGAGAARAANGRLGADLHDVVMLMFLLDGMGCARWALDPLELMPALFVASETGSKAERAAKHACSGDVGTRSASSFGSFGKAEAIAAGKLAPRAEWAVIFRGGPSADIYRIALERQALSGRMPRPHCEILRVRGVALVAMAQAHWVLGLVESVASADRGPPEI
ncbi:unnamed protein product, partial [Prorocentrum cordatum]